MPCNFLSYAPFLFFKYNKVTSKTACVVRNTPTTKTA